MKNWKVGWIVAGGLLLILLVISLTPKKQETRPEPVKQVQLEKKPVKAEQKVNKPVSRPKLATPAPQIQPAPTPTLVPPTAVPVPTPQIQPAVINVYCNCTPQVQALTPAPPPPVSLPSKIPPLPPEAQTTGWWIVITDQTQSYTDSWGLRWVIDTNGGFYCPWVENPTGWINGHQMWMFHPDYPKKGWYTKLAPGCYR